MVNPNTSPAVTQLMYASSSAWVSYLQRVCVGTWGGGAYAQTGLVFLTHSENTTEHTSVRDTINLEYHNNNCDVTKLCVKHYNTE